MLQGIKRAYKGEEQANRILAAHRDMGGTPFVPARGVHSEGYAETYVPASQAVGGEAR